MKNYTAGYANPNNQVLWNNLMKNTAPPSNDYIDLVRSGVIAGKPPANLTQAHITTNWNDVPDSPQGEIVNEIARKFNTIPGSITNVRRNPRPTSYYENVLSNPYNFNPFTLPGGGGGIEPTLTFGIPGGQTGPDPRVIGHELMHAIDNQGTNINARVWDNLMTLANSHADYDTAKKFGKGIQRIQDKIDPTYAFGDLYPMKLVDIARNIKAGREFYGIGPVANRNYTLGSIPKNPMQPGPNPRSHQNFKPDWPTLQTDIRDITTHAGAAYPYQNDIFYLNAASEYPAFMSERLTQPWQTSVNVPGANFGYGMTRGHQALRPQEARFVRNTLGDMDTDYPAAQYPVMNHYIRERSNSVDNAFNGVPGYSRGGRVTRYIKSFR